jgi:hypothetical protein
MASDCKADMRRSMSLSEMALQVIGWSIWRACMAQRFSEVISNSLWIAVRSQLENKASGARVSTSLSGGRVEL